MGCHVMTSDWFHWLVHHRRVTPGRHSGSTTPTKSLLPVPGFVGRVHGAGTAAFVAGTEPFELVFFCMAGIDHIISTWVGKVWVNELLKLPWICLLVVGISLTCQCSWIPSVWKTKTSGFPPEIRASCTAKKCSANTRLPQELQPGKSAPTKTVVF